MFNLQKTWLSYLFICSGITRIARGIILVYMHTITYAPPTNPPSYTHGNSDWHLPRKLFTVHWTWMEIVWTACGCSI